jgi:AhpD family alkylhydroperoxidase
MADSPKIPLPHDDELSDENRAILEALPPANVFRMVANSPTALPGFVAVAKSILVDAELPARDREIAVLRVAQLTDAEYEWVHHVRIALRAGVTDEEIEAIAAGGDSLDEGDRLLCRVAEEMTRDIRLSDEALAQLLQRYGVRQTTELIFCVGYFNMLSRFLESTRVPLEDYDPAERWTPVTN